MTKQQHTQRARLINQIKWTLAGYGLGMLPARKAETKGPAIEDVLGNLQAALDALRK
jgi:transposase